MTCSYFIIKKNKSHFEINSFYFYRIFCTFLCDNDEVVNAQSHKVQYWHIFYSFLIFCCYNDGEDFKLPRGCTANFYDFCKLLLVLTRQLQYILGSGAPKLNENGVKHFICKCKHSQEQVIFFHTELFIIFYTRLWEIYK